jgi:hypothetical protein
LHNEVSTEGICNERKKQTYIREKKERHLECQKRSTTMHVQEPEQRQSCEISRITGQEYNAYRAEAEGYAQQKLYPEETLAARVHVPEILTIVFSSVGLGPAIIGLVGSIIVLANRDESLSLLAGGILGLVGSVVALIFFVTICALSLVSAARRAARSRRSRLH